MKLDPSKPPTSSMVYSALAGNPCKTTNQFLEGSSIGVDSLGNADVGGWTYNTDLYVSPHAFQNAPATTPNAYIFELNPAGSAITNGTYLGGGANDFIKALAVDKLGNVYVSGATYSWDFPTDS
jgi:Beta-propeller repeat